MSTDGSADLAATSLPNRAPFFVVGIGASAGGLEALEEFFSHTSRDSGMAYVVIQHLSPDFTSVMDQLLARRTTLPIRTIENGVEVEPDHVYLLPPKKEVIIAGGKLLLTDRDPQNQLAFPIDEFFRSLAQDAGRYAVAVVLSGTGTDGSRGILDVHANGGLVVVQNEETAKFNGMPRSACESGIVDMVLPAHEVSPALIRYAENPLIDNKDQLKTGGVMEDSMASIFNALRERYQIDFSEYKTATICRRIERRLMLSNSLELDEYARLVTSSEDELDRLYKDLLIGVTGFFRDSTVFDRLELDVLPELLERIPEGAEFRAWVAGTATGEEAYSLAILLHESMERSNRQHHVKIFASDMHQGSLKTASRGVYQENSLEGVTPERLQKFFIQRSDGYHVAPELRKMIVFTPHNCIKDAPFTKLDLVSCRNVMIYFSPPVQRKVLSLFHFGLKRDGVLCLGTSETTGDLSDEFAPIDERLRLYRKHRDTRLPANMRMPLTVTMPESLRKSTPAPMLGGVVPASDLISTYDKLLGQFMPPSLLINERQELLHSFSGAGRFLRIGDGRPSPDILDIVHPDLRSALAAALRRVQKEQTAVQFTGIRCTTDDEMDDIDLSVHPFAERDGLRSYLVRLESREPTLRIAQPREIDASELSNEEFETLERELQHTKDSLQSTIEELQTTNEELQAANEQLTASNEELQSTNEELHSVNEELYTVNAEHSRKIDQLTEMTDDMDNLLNSTNVHTIFLDTDLCIRRFTPGIAETFSLIPQDVGRRFDSFTHRIQDDDLAKEVQRVLETGESFDREVSDKRGVRYLLRILPYVARGQVDGVVVTLIDITSLKQAQAQLQQLSEIVEHSDDAIYRVDLDGTVRTWNLGACRLYRYDADAILDRHVSLLAPDDRQTDPAQYLERIRRGISVDHVETQRKRRDGTLVDVSLTVSPIRDDRRQIVGASVIARDITKQKQAELEIREAVRRRDQFLAMLSHELRNPLAAILNATSLLKEKALDEASADEAREVIEHQLQHVARLLDDLLDVARVTNGKLTLHKEVIDLGRLMMDVVDCIQYQTEEKDQRLQVYPADEPLYVEGDVGRLQQAQVNLLVNACKYSPAGAEIVYLISREVEDAVITVRDNGEGISPELISTIFEPFVQSEQTIDRAKGGMGLGLPLVQMIAAAHNGRVSVHSDGLGRGSEFTIRLPLTDKTPAEEAAQTESVCLDGSRLLLIEDNDGIRKMLARSLELKGFEVATACDGRDGLEILEDFLPEVAVIDIGLPDMNGYEVAEAIRGNEVFSSMLLIAATGYGREEDREKALAAGFDVHLVKPIDPTELMQEIIVFEKDEV